MIRKIASSALVFLFLAASVQAAEDNWPSFRGGNAMSQVQDDPRLPDSWSETENVAWKIDVPGLAWSSPVIWGDRVFVTSVASDGQIEEPKKGLYFGGNRPEPSKNAHHWQVYAFDTVTGEQVWETTVKSGPPDFARHLKNTYASETPTTDGERIYAYFGNVGVFALDTKGGEVIWEHEPGVVRTRYGWGTAASPILHGDQLYVVNDNEDQSYFAALDKKTGKELWRADRDEGSNWATPFVWENPQRTEVITAGTDLVRSYDTKGNLLWEFGGMSSIAIPQPFAAHGLLYVSSGYVGDQKRPVFAIRPGAEGDISLENGQTSNEWIVWFLPQAGAYNPTPLIYGDYFYTLLDRGFFTMHNAKTGEEVYGKQRIERGASAFTASPWAYNGKIFVTSEDCDTFVIDAGEEFTVVGKSSLDDMCMATPAIADGAVYLRTRTHLYKFSKGS
ncbi:MAG: PQQ-binding-like beta-propeller repeat protein [Acidobacteriota bacterium]|nr:PQQ-binding-like beta-propeller repeat protein [Acidobacteriota bacterium]